MTAKQSIEERLEELEAIIKNSPEAIVTIKETGLVCEWSGAAERIFGWTRVEALGSPIHKLIIPEFHRAAHNKGLKRLAKSQEPLTLTSPVTIKGLHKDGSIVPVELRLSEYPAKEGRRFTAIIRDRSEPTRLVAEIAEKDEKALLLHAAIDASNDSYFLINRETGKFLDTNKAACAQLGYTREELLNLKVPDIEEKLSTIEEYRAHINEIEKKGAGTFEGLHIKKNGERFPVDISVATIKYRGDRYSIAIARDITEDLKKQSVLRASLQNNEARIRELQGLYRMTEAATHITSIDKLLQETADLIPLSYRYPAHARGRVLFGEKEYVSGKFEQTPWRQAADIMVSGKRAGSIEAHYLKNFPDADEGPFHKEERILLEALSKILGTALERRKGLEDLRASEERHKALFEKSNAIMLQTDPANGRILNANKAALKFYGYTHEELLSRSIFEINMEPPDVVRNKIAEVQAGNEKFCNLRHRTASGKILDVEVFVSTIEFDKKSFISSIIHDVSERQRTQQSLIRLKAAIDAAEEAIIITERDGLIIFANPAFERSSGYTIAEAIGENPRILKSGKHKPLFYERMWKTIIRGETWHGVIVNKAKDGRIYHEDTGITPITTSEGRITHFVAIKRDITDTIKLQERMAVSEKLASAGLLASGVAHEVNNPLTIILGLAQILSEEEAMPEVFKTDLSAIEEQARRAGRITQGLLQFSRNKDPEKTELLIEDVFDKLKPLIVYDMKKSDIDIQFKLENTNLTINADPDQIQQVLLNLVINAKHAVSKSKIKEILITAGEKDGSIIISVRDTGSGIPEDVKKYIFDPFFTTKPVGEGTGLGLPLCYSIATDHGGTLEAESKPGQGALFSLILPKK